MEQIPENQTPLLIVDDDPGFLLTVKEILKHTGMVEPALVTDSERVPELLDSHPFQCVVIDMVMPKVDGLTLLKQIKSSHPEVECIIVTVLDDISSAVQAIKYGAYDYILKPISADKLVIVIKRALERFCMKHELALYDKLPSRNKLKSPEAFDAIIASDPAMVRVFHQVEIVAPTDYSVIITGESGTGKELIARTIHALSLRRNMPFVPVNMGAVSGTLFQDDFFGHARGAYTGAGQERKGFLEAAEEGTLFMDEITDLDLTQQGALLRVLQEREFYRLGSTESRSINVRIIAATNRSIETEIERENFRADLYHRLNMFHIHIPPLRERKGDVLVLARYFLKQFCEKNGKRLLDIPPLIATMLTEYPYPGNVRELKNIIASGVLQEKSDTLTLDSLPDILVTGSASATDPYSSTGLKTLAEVERDHIRKVLEATQGNRTHAAKMLGIGRRTLQRKLKSVSGE